MNAEGRGGKLGVVVFQLGGPDSLAAVEPFLYNLFSDPDIIDFPFARLARPTLARLISSRRARHVEEHYAAIGGKSPIRELTERQAGALERELRECRGLDARVVTAMRYWHPLTEAAIEQVARGDFRELILLPLYPQYSKTTTGSSLNEWRRLYGTNGNGPVPTRTIHHFYDHPAYLDSVVEKINEGLARFTDDAPSANAELIQSPLSASSADDVWLVFSAHGVPMRVIEAGDPYQAHIESTVRLVMERGGWRNPHVLCYQSRVSPGKWLEPSLGETLRALAANGLGPEGARKDSQSGGPAHASGAGGSALGPLIDAGASGPTPDDAGRRAKRVLVIPISFVTDHVETLAEIDIEARKLAYTIGIEHFELMPALNDSPAFIRALADLVLAHVSIRASEVR